MSRVVLAYSGGLDTSVLLKKMILEGHEVIALTADLGESDGAAGDGAKAALDAVKAKALALGAYDAVLIDARERLIGDYCLPALRANAKYQGVYPLSAALSRPLIGALLAETAEQYGATVVAHGCTGKGNDQVRIELAVKSIAPHLTVRARGAALSAGCDRVCARSWRADLAYRREAVFDRCESVGTFDRGGRAGRSVERAAGRCVCVDGFARGAAAAPRGYYDYVRWRRAVARWDGRTGDGGGAKRAGRSARDRADRYDRGSRGRVEIARGV